MLAGGKSSRMGRNKALLPVGAQTMIESIVAALAPHFKKVSVIAKDQADYSFLKVPVYTDLFPGDSPLVGIYTGLKMLGRGGAFFTTCDFPLAGREWMEFIRGVEDGCDAVCFESQAGLEPFPAFYFKTALGTIAEQLTGGALGVRNCLNGLRVKKIPTALNFASINTPEEFESFKRTYEVIDYEVPR